MIDERKHPKVSICLMAYNHQSYIQETLHSIFSQTDIKKCELIISNDGSTDDTARMIEETLKDCPIKYRFFNRKVNIGAEQSAYNLIDASKGEYLAWIDGDDIWYDPQKISKQLKVFNESNSTVVCTAYKPRSDSCLSNIDHQIKKEELNFQDLIRANKIPFSSVMTKKTAWLKQLNKLENITGPNGETYLIDYAQWLMVSRHEKILKINNSFVGIGYSEDSMTRPHDIVKRIEFLKYLLRMKRYFLQLENQKFYRPLSLIVNSKMIFLIFKNHLLNIYFRSRLLLSKLSITQP